MTARYCSISTSKTGIPERLCSVRLVGKEEREAGRDISYGCGKEREKGVWVVELVWTAFTGDDDDELLSDIVDHGSF